jgi:hypothetical protein
LSVDFRLPPGLSPVVDVEEIGETFFIPLTVLRRDTRLMRFDLRDENGSALPLLTRKENARISGAALAARAHELLTAAGRPGIPKPIERAIAHIPTSPFAQSLEFARALLNPHATEWAWPRLAGTEGDRGILRADELFRKLASLLLGRAVVFTPLVMRPGERRIVKLAYDEEAIRERPSGRVRRAMTWFGWRETVVGFDASLVGDSDTYHFEIQTPPDVEMTEACLVARSPEEWVRRRLDPDPSEPGEPAITQFVPGPHRRSHLYVEEAQEVLSGFVWVGLRARRQGFLRGAATASCFVAAVMAFYFLFDDAIVDLQTSAATLLLLVPGLLVAYAIRPGEHEIARSLYKGARILLGISGVVAFAAAAALLALGPTPGPQGGDLDSPACLSLAWGLLALAAVVMAAGLIISLLRPPRGTDVTKHRARMAERHREVGEEARG